MEVSDEHAAMCSPRKSPGNRRPRLLHSWGSSLILVAHKIYRKAAEPENRIGNLVRILAWMASPFLHPIQQIWLATLSFIDDRIFTIENIAMAIFPPTTHIFTKVDELAHLGQSLPQKLDDATDSLLPLLHELPLFDDVMKYVFAEKWSSSDERDIMVDMNYYDEQRKVVETSAEEKTDSGNEGEEIAKLSHDKAWNVKSTEGDIKEAEDTCKVIMSALEEMGMTAERKGGEGEVSEKKQSKKTDRVDPDDTKVVKSDPILELFDEGWQLKPILNKVEDLAEQVEVAAEMDEQQELLAEAEEVDPVEKQAELFMDNYAHRTSKCRSISHISPIW